VSETQIQPSALARKHGGLPVWLSRLRSYFFWDPLVWIYTIVLGTLSLLSSFFDQEGRIQHGFARFWARTILGTIGARVAVEGLEATLSGPARVYVVNHLSALDIPVLYGHLPFQFRILAKRELFRYPFMGWHLSRSGQIPVDLEDAKRSLRSLNRAVATIKSGMSLVVFPEGGRSPNGELQPFMAGAFYAAVRAQAEIVPMALVGTYETLPMNTWHIKPHPIHLLAGKPIPTQGRSVREMEQLVHEARNTIAHLYRSVRAQDHMHETVNETVNE